MKPLRVAILWHMHQPDYFDPVAGQTLLPWTYLHAVKDYGDMLKTAAEVESTRMTFNLVPTLIEQLDRYVAGEANDHWLELARRNPADLGETERQTLLRQFFSVHHERHLLPRPKYRELLKRRGTAIEPDIAGFSDQDLRDLQVLFLLAWSGHHLGREELVRHLRAKEERYGEDEKAALLARYDREVGEVLDRYRELEESGRIEVSVTPYAHPILPLLCGNAVARQAAPDTPLPQHPYRHPLDAELQVRHGLQQINRRFGPRPRGMWPSEGAVSEEVLGIMQRAGVAWTASDEEILRKSLAGGLHSRAQLYRPYSFGEVPIVFRDRELSDRIGFIYAHWQAERAAADLLGHLRRAARTAPDGLLSLILDGENCWERYADNGYPFLHALYRGIDQCPDLELVTLGEALSELSPTPLGRLAPGSWIDGNFRIWIGHPEENRAWDLLAAAREETGIQTRLEAQPETAAEPPSAALRHLMHAEGSDWFWWYGDDHVTAQAELFDRLFRRHLEALYREVGMTPPEALSQPIKPVRGASETIEPRACLTPCIDGRVSDYFEWLGAGQADLAGSGAMHAGDDRFERLYYAYDRSNLYLRIDPAGALAFAPRQTLALRLEAERSFRVEIDPARPAASLYGEAEKPLVDCRVAIDRVIELAVPLAPLGLAEGDLIQVSLLLCDKQQEKARWPAEGKVELPYRGAGLEADNWSL